MLNIHKNKKGFNDVTFIFVILIFFIGSGAIFSAIESEASTNYEIEPLKNYTGVGDGQEFVTGTPTGLVGVIRALVKVLFWNFEGIPWIISLLYNLLTIIFGVLIYRLFRSGGG